MALVHVATPSRRGWQANDAAELAEQAAFFWPPTRRRAEFIAQELVDAAMHSAPIEALVGRAESLRRTHRDAAALLAVEAYRLADTPRTRSSLFATFTDDERFLDAHRFDGRRGTGGVGCPDGETPLPHRPGRPLRPYDLVAGTLGDPLPALGGGVDRSPVLAASTDGRRVQGGARCDASVGPTTVGVQRHHQRDADASRRSPWMAS